MYGGEDSLAHSISFPGPFGWPFRDRIIISAVEVSPHWETLLEGVRALVPTHWTRIDDTLQDRRHHISHHTTPDVAETTVHYPPANPHRRFARHALLQQCPTLTTDYCWFALQPPDDEFLLNNIRRATNSWLSDQDSRQRRTSFCTDHRGKSQPSSRRARRIRYHWSNFFRPNCQWY